MVRRRQDVDLLRAAARDVAQRAEDASLDGEFQGLAELELAIVIGGVGGWGGGGVGDEVGARDEGVPARPGGAVDEEGEDFLGWSGDCGGGGGIEYRRHRLSAAKGAYGRIDGEELPRIAGCFRDGSRAYF